MYSPTNYLIFELHVGDAQSRAKVFAYAWMHVWGKTGECWLRMIIHLDYYEHLPHLSFGSLCEVLERKPATQSELCIHSSLLLWL